MRSVMRHLAWPLLGPMCSLRSHSALATGPVLINTLSKHMNKLSYQPKQCKVIRSNEHTNPPKSL